MKKYLHLDLATLIITIVSPCGAQLHLWSTADNGNDHLYEAVIAPNGISWTDANALAEKSGGHLVTLNSASENEYVHSIINHERYWDGPSGPWIGGYQPSGAREPDGGWRWVTDEPFLYTNWNESQPNEFSSNNESRIQFGYGYWTNRWNDVPDTSVIVDGRRIVSFIIEYEVRQTDTVHWDYDSNGNGHTYLAVCMKEGIAWDQANSIANKMEGYLATVTSSQENLVIQGLVSDMGYWTELAGYTIAGPWLGGYQLPGSMEPDGGWLWSITEPFVYTDWGTGLPDNKPDTDQNANCLHLLRQHDTRRPQVLWNDMPQDSTEITSFVIEFPLVYPLLPGDLNYDGNVDSHDLVLWDIIWLELNLSLE